MDGSRHRIPSFRDWFNSFIRPPLSIFIGPDCVILSVVESYPSQLSGVKSVSGSSGEKNYIIIISIPFVKTLHQAHSRDLNPHPDQYLASNKVSCQRVGRIERPSLPITDAIFCSSFRAANRQTGCEKPIKILQCTSHQSHYYPLFLFATTISGQDISHFRQLW